MDLSINQTGNRQEKKRIAPVPIFSLRLKAHVIDAHTNLIAHANTILVDTTRNLLP